MTDNTETTKTPEISFDQAKAILSVAYLFAAIDGKICDEEQGQFRAIMKQLFGGRYADAEVMTYLEGVSEEARKLMALRNFYTDDEDLVKAFAAKSATAVATVVNDAYTLRCAFAIWISICCADKDYSRIERSAVKCIQKMVNPTSFFKEIKPPKSGAKVAGVAATAAAMIPGVGLLALPIAGALLVANAGQVGIGYNITDAFLADVEKRIRKIGEIHAKMEAADNVDIKQNYKDMYDFEVENFKEFLASK